MGWTGGVFTEGTVCEDAPCCGCCGPENDRLSDRHDYYCDVCGWDHFGPCPDDEEEE